MQSCRSSLTHTRHPSALTDSGIAQLLVPRAEPPHLMPSCFSLQHPTEAGLHPWPYGGRKAEEHKVCLCASPHPSTQVAHIHPCPPVYLLAGEAAWPRRHRGVLLLRPALPLSSPLASSLGLRLSCSGSVADESLQSLP